MGTTSTPVRSSKSSARDEHAVRSPHGAAEKERGPTTHKSRLDKHISGIGRNRRLSRFRQEFRCPVNDETLLVVHFVSTGKQQAGHKRVSAWQTLWKGLQATLSAAGYRRTAAVWGKKRSAAQGKRNSSKALFLDILYGLYGE